MSVENRLNEEFRKNAEANIRLPVYMLRTDKSHNTVAVSQTCIPPVSDSYVGISSIAGMGEQITYASFEEMEKITKGIPFGVSSRGAEMKDTGKLISEDKELAPMEFMSKRFIMERYLNILPENKKKEELISNYDNAMKFVV